MRVTTTTQLPSPHRAAMTTTTRPPPAPFSPSPGQIQERRCLTPAPRERSFRLLHHDRARLAKLLQRCNPRSSSSEVSFCAELGFPLWCQHPQRGLEVSSTCKPRPTATDALRCPLHALVNCLRPCPAGPAVAQPHRLPARPSSASASPCRTASAPCSSPGLPAPRGAKPGRLASRASPCSPNPRDCGPANSGAACCTCPGEYANSRELVDTPKGVSTPWPRATRTCNPWRVPRRRPTHRRAIVAHLHQPNACQPAAVSAYVAWPHNAVSIFSVKTDAAAHHPPRPRRCCASSVECAGSCLRYNAGPRCLPAADARRQARKKQRLWRGPASCWCVLAMPGPKTLADKPSAGGGRSPRPARAQQQVRRWRCRQP